MKLTKKLLAGLLAISMVATGSSVFAATNTITSVEEGNNTASQNVTGTAQFTDALSVDVEWQDLQFKYVRTWDAEKKEFKAAEWSLVTGGTAENGSDAGNAIKATNKSARSYDLSLAFTPTSFDTATDYGNKRDYSKISGKFYSTVTKAAPSDDTNKIDKLVLPDINLSQPNADRSQTAWLWLSGDPENKSAADAIDSIGNYGFKTNDTADEPNSDAAQREVFGTVTVTLANHTD